MSAGRGNAPPRTYGGHTPYEQPPGLHSIGVPEFNRFPTPMEVTVSPVGQKVPIPLSELGDATSEQGHDYDQEEKDKLAEMRAVYAGGKGPDAGAPAEYCPEQEPPEEEGQK